ncbi:MAG: ClbS/DfsB family four-helix bundle protein [Anaerolineales bacterium]|nr:ClbS/DfsB family four-helix bundle protein [Anaerolineales bacterium]
MFGSRNEQLADLDLAYKEFIQTTEELSAEGFIKSLGDWTPRDILAHFIGWNRITLVGCAEICEGVEPFYFYDGTNDYRKVNAAFFERFDSTDREVLLRQVESTKEALVSYLKTVDESEWEQDTGVIHYRGGLATVARCVDSLIRDYYKHREEIISGIN